jgi:hypothetical protein
LFEEILEVWLVARAFTKPMPSSLGVDLPLDHEVYCSRVEEGAIFFVFQMVAAPQARPDRK